MSLMPAIKAEDETKQTPPHSDSMTVGQARRAVVAGFRAAYYYHLGVDPGSFRFILDSIEFDAKLHEKGSQHFKVDLRTLSPVLAKRRWDRAYQIKDEAGKDLPYPLNQVIFWGKDREGHAALLTSGLNSLRVVAMNRQTMRGEFRQRAAAWRTLTVKPPIPEEVRAQRLLAENAVKEKQFEKALDHYEAGLEILPTWPQGQFNAALVAAELKYYADAVEHMQAYLELVPDAPDAQAARDQIAIWQYKAKGTK